MEGVTNTLAAIESWTGESFRGCPWRPLFDGFIARVIDAHRAWKERQLLAYVPRPSWRLMQAILFYDGKLSSIEARQAQNAAKAAAEARSRAAQGADRG